MSGNELDGLDLHLIELMSRDARVSNRKLAAELGVTEGTVRGRLKRLQQEGLIAFTAVTSLEMAEKSQLGFISIQAEVENVRGIARDIAALPSVNAVMITMAQFNILALCLFDTLECLVDLASDQILAIKGVHHVETSIAVKTLKYNPRMAKITPTNR